MFTYAESTITLITQSITVNTFLLPFLVLVIIFFHLFQRFSTLPTIFVTVSHQIPMRPQDAMAVWVEELRENNFKICLREAKIFDGPHKNIKIVSGFAFVFPAVSVKPCQSTESPFLPQRNLDGKENKEYLSLHTCTHICYDAAEYAKGQPNHLLYIKKFSPFTFDFQAV